MARSEEARKKELQQIEAYKDLSDSVNTKVGRSQRRQFTVLI